jgi:hypothetical protein
MLHVTYASFQCMLPESFAIVYAPSSRIQGTCSLLRTMLRPWLQPPIAVIYLYAKSKLLASAPRLASYPNHTRQTSIFLALLASTVASSASSIKLYFYFMFPFNAPDGVPPASKRADTYRASHSPPSLPHLTCDSEIHYSSTCDLSLAHADTDILFMAYGRMPTGAFTDAQYAMWPWRVRI